MSEVGNRREGGRFVFQDIRVDEKGPWTKQDLEYLINRATSRSIDDILPEIYEIWDPTIKTDSINEGHSGYIKKVVIPIEEKNTRKLMILNWAFSRYGISSLLIRIGVHSWVRQEQSDVQSSAMRNTELEDVWEEN